MFANNNADEEWKSRVPAAVQRLRKSKALLEEANGTHEGREWALNAELQDLLNLAHRHFNENGFEFIDAMPWEDGLEKVWIDLGFPDRDFATRIAPAQMRGFLNGALEVWEEIRGQL